MGRDDSFIMRFRRICHFSATAARNRLVVARRITALSRSYDAGAYRLRSSARVFTTECHDFA